MGEKLSESAARDRMTEEIAKLRGTISVIESDFQKIGESMQKIDAYDVIGENGELKKPVWTKLHNEYTALVHASQLGANEVKSKINNFLFIIGSYGEEDHQKLRTHLDTYINDLKEFQDKAAPIETRFLRLTRGIDTFRSSLKEDVGQEESEVEKIDRQILDRRAKLFSPTALFVNWGKKATELDHRSLGGEDRLATAGITSLAPHTAAESLRGPLESLGFPVKEAMESKIRPQELKEKLNERHKQKSSRGRALKEVERIIAGLDGRFEETITRLYTVRCIWHALRMDAHTLQTELGSSSDLDSQHEKIREVAISRLKLLYTSLWFALDKYTLEIATEPEPKTAPTEDCLPAVDGISKTCESGVRDDIQGEILELAATISRIESNFIEIGRNLEKIDDQKVIWVNSKLKTYFPKWAKLHDEYTALVHESQLSANEVQAKIKNLLSIIESYGEEDHQLLRTHLDTYIKDLKEFLDGATPIETRFLRLSQGVRVFRSNLQEDVIAQHNLNDSEVKEIDWQIKELQAELFSTSALFVNWWEKKIIQLDRWSHRGDSYMATVGIAALAPVTAAKLLRAQLESVGFSFEKTLESRQRRQELRKKLKDCHDQKISLTSSAHILQDVEGIIEGFDGIFEDTIDRLFTVRSLWHALRMDAHTLQTSLGSASDLESHHAKIREVAISRFKPLYDTLWFALNKYTAAVEEKTVPFSHDTNTGGKSDSVPGPRGAEPPRSSSGIFSRLFKRS